MAPVLGVTAGKPGGGVRTLTTAALRRCRTHSQRLSGSRAKNVHDLVRDVVCLQAQATSAARLAVRARSTGLSAAAVTKACNEERSVVRTWAMRGTLHMLPSEDAGWLVAMLAPGFERASRGRRLQLGLDEDVLSRALRALREILGRDGPLPRAELVRQLAGQGVRLDPSGQAPAHLVRYAALRGVVCRGPDLDDDEPTYVRWEDWVPAVPARAPESALAELARRYLRGYGPAGPQDFASWSGIALGQAKRGFQLIGDELEEVDAAGQRAWTLAIARPTATARPTAAAQAPCVRLLGRFDTYLLGYHGRDVALSPRFAKRIQAGGGLIHPAVLLDGRVVGTWRQQRGRSELTVRVELFELSDPPILSQLAAEVADIGRFLGEPARLDVLSSPPVPGA